MGTREMAKALVKAADAAAAPNPSKPGGAPQPVRREAAAATPARPVSPIIQKAAKKAVQVQRTSRGVREGSRRFGQAVWAPAARIGSVLWLEVTGVFFALFAGTGVVYCWEHWRAIQGGTALDQRRLALMAGMALVFGYFCISSFVRARRRERR